MNDTINFDDNDEFNPDLNYEDKEQLENLDRLERAVAYKAKQKQQADVQRITQKLFEDGFMEACEEEGLAPSEMQTFLQQLSIENPQAVQQFFKNNVKEYWKGIGEQGKTRARDPKTGQFVKAQPQPRPQPQAGRQAMMQKAQPQPKQNEGLANLQERVNKGYVPTEDEVLDILPDLF